MKKDWIPAFAGMTQHFFHTSLKDYPGLLNPLDNVVTKIHNDYIMIEVNVRNLKAGLSHYLRMVESGELIAIKIRDRLVGFLSQKPPPHKNLPGTMTSTDTEKLISQLKAKGYIHYAKRYQHRFTKPVNLKKGSPLSQLIRQMRDEA